MSRTGYWPWMLVVLAIVVPWTLAARQAPEESGFPDLPGAGVVLENTAVNVKDEALPLAELTEVPERARWAVIKNNSGVAFFLGARRNLTLDDSWPVCPGETFAFSLARPVYLKTAVGTLDVRVLFGR
jgi:hypothetical protein